MPLLEVLANLDSDVQIIIRIVILYSYKYSLTSNDIWNTIGDMMLLKLYRNVALLIINHLRTFYRPIGL